MIKEKTPVELKAMRESNEVFQLIDVRDEYELEISSLNGEHISMADIMANTNRIQKDVPVIIFCRTGQRAKAVITALEMNHHFDNLHNLKGGINGYAEEVDQSMETY